MSTLPATIGRYQVRERLGQGGMGVLYLAYDPELDRRVAIKLLRVSDEEMRERFVRESRIAARLQHPHIVGIYDVGDYQGQPFIAMEFIEGDTLADLIARRVALPLVRKIALIKELCEGLAFAHRAGVVHRDIKPANLMVNRQGLLKILDFGIARLGDSGMTQVGVLMGTPNYMSPEQVEGQKVDARSDIFAVGLVLYELLTGRAAFAAPTQHQTLHRILHDEPVVVTAIDASLDPQLDHILAQALQKRPEKRYQDLMVLKADLARLSSRLEEGGRAGLHAAAASTVETADPRGATTGRRGVDLTSLMRRRAEQIGAHLEAAERAFAAGELEAALASCEDAALLDPDEPRTVALIEKVRQAIEDRQSADFLAAARTELESGSLTGARDLVAQALQMRPGWDEAIALERDVAEREAAAERERQRQAQIDGALSRARAALQVFAYETAARAADEALALEPTHPDALALRREADDALERERQQAAEAARREAEAAAARERERQEAAEAARRDAEAEAARERERREARTRDMTAALSRIEQHLSAGQLAEAATAIAEAEATFGPAPALTLLKVRRDSLLRPTVADDSADKTVFVAGPGGPPPPVDVSADATVFIPQPPARPVAPPPPATPVPAPPTPRHTPAPSPTVAPRRAEPQPVEILSRAPDPLPVPGRFLAVAVIVLVLALLLSLLR